MILNKLIFAGMKKTRILLADAHPLTREGLKSILSRQYAFEVVSEVNNASDLATSIVDHNPDILIIDFYVSGHFSIEDVGFLRKHFPSVHIFIITTNKVKQDIIRVLDQNVSAYLLKECDEEEIISALEAIMNGEKFFCGKVMDSILDKSNHICTESSDCNHCMAISLSNREIEIVKLIAEGLTTKDIASKLHLSFFTVATHRKNIFRKLQIRNSPELILYALKEGIISHQAN